MTSFPRAIMGQVCCMARPRRPEAEARAVREAAAIVKAETGLTSAKALSREIAARVVKEFLHELEADPLDLAFAAIERELLRSPFKRLASCPDIDLASDFVERRVQLLRARAGRFLSVAEQDAECRAICRSLQFTVANRYARVLRN